MRVSLVVILALVGCGSVKGSGGQDASSDGQNVCTIHDTVDSCGASCARCTATADREVPTCDGTACGTACAGAAPQCTDRTCSRLTWSFASNTLEGVTARAPAGLALAVRNHAGNLALAIDTTLDQARTGEISFRVPVCLSGTVQLQARTLSAVVTLEGTGPAGEQYYMQASTPGPMSGAILTQKAIAASVPTTYSAPLSGSQFANAATDVVFQIGTFGAVFTGTIWVDDIKIE